MGMPIVVLKPYTKSDHESLADPCQGIPEIRDRSTNEIDPKGFVSVPPTRPSTRSGGQSKVNNEEFSYNTVPNVETLES